MHGRNYFVFTPKFHTNKVLASKKCVKGQEEMRALKLGDCFDVPEASTELLVVHLWIVLPDAPSSGNFIWVGHLELPTITGPVDEVGGIGK